MHKEVALGGRILTPVFMGMATLVGLMVIALGFRFVLGLGAVSNMSDGYPWGIWIAYDVVVGSAFACGGYVMALTVYVFNKGRYHPLVRPALLASMFGYTLAGASVMFDIGRYFHAYNLFLPWQINYTSVMLEVALCVTAYIIVLWIEFAPAITSKFKLDRLTKILEKTAFFFIAVGVTLPMMHQSSLGTMMIIAGEKLHPLWQTQMLPLFFLFSALFMGFAMVVFEGSIVSKAYRLGDETTMLSKMAKASAIILSIFILLRIQNVLLNKQVANAFEFDTASITFLMEMLLMCVGLVILAIKKLRTSPRYLFVGAVLILLGSSLYRFNVYLIAYAPIIGDWNYFPSIGEQIVSYGLIATEIAAYTFFVKYFAVFTKHEKH